MPPDTAERRPGQGAVPDEAVGGGNVRASLQATVYASAALDYQASGWGSPLPLPPRRKQDPPKGYTGRAGKYPARSQVETWCRDQPHGNIAARLLPGVLGLDVDAYKSPEAARAWRELEERLGQLPGGPRSTSRDDGISGIRLFRVPEGYEAAGTLPGGCGELIQPHHRYMIVWPSIHPDTGATYQWDDGRIPSFGDLPELPKPWLDALSGTAEPAAAGQPALFQQPANGHRYPTKLGYTNPDINALAASGMQAGTQHDQMRDVVAQLVGKGLDRPAVEAVWWTIVAKTTLHDPERWTQDYFDSMYEGAAAKYVSGNPNTSGTPLEKPVPQVPPMTIAQVEAVYKRWLHDGDTVTTRVCHAVYVANLVLTGDPVWVFLVGGSGQGKTERIAPLSELPHVELASTLSGEAALLSATPKRDRADSAHGGLLRRIGDKGVLVIKDFTSILEMDRTDRGKVLAALREVYDGRWDREVGAEGGRTLTWIGKCGLLAASTTSIDRAHAVMNDMGPRSLFVRLPPADSAEIGASALDHMGCETAMRAELATATAGLLTHLPGQPHDIGPARSGLIGLASLVALARSPVHRDWSGEIELVGDPEAPTRIVKQLGQLWRACGVLGLGKRASWEVVSRCALDSIPKLRGIIIRYLAGQAGAVSTTGARIAVAHPKRTVLRALEDLAAHHVVTRTSAGQGHADEWELSDRTRSWIASIEGVPKALASPSPEDSR